ncbi:N-acetylmuramoyl-L-alanine amidase [Aestuariibacter halophilus]|uniref:N-acetylmuramoyl-L-alanine amidase n=1 Tax=Fluctibacter halophilus TaxID=226011 RepID=A0ABS8G8U4_9ALTE|nr:N-acetylmuramoyl-L-alanine amidase [Aestuariibacter halophilus]MCC2616879.1 N-acetylmuramoyl-L-alanine amidase [Aestuariibacter halophilus]
MTPDYIVIHTAAFNGKDCDKDMIDSWHRAKGWNGIGYHYVILNDKHSHKSDGMVEKGRPDHVQGAHALGLNSRSLGICCVGHGDENDFTEAQYDSLIALLDQLMETHSIPVSRVIGHRELNLLVDRGVLSDRYRTAKSCPGNQVDMQALRKRLTKPATVSPPEPQSTELADAMAVLAQHQDRFGNARDEWAAFYYHPEIIALRQRRIT